MSTSISSFGFGRNVGGMRSASLNGVSAVNVGSSTPPGSCTAAACRSDARPAVPATATPATATAATPKNVRRSATVTLTSSSAPRDGRTDR
jgi:hypothetical protein